MTSANVQAAPDSGSSGAGLGTGDDRAAAGGQAASLPVSDQYAGEDLFRIAFENHPDAVALIGPGNCLIAANSAFRTIMGTASLADLSLPGTPLQTAPDPELPPPVRRISLMGRHFDLAISELDGGRQLLRLADATERVAQEAVSARLRQAFDLVEETVAIYDVEDRLAFANAAWRERFMPFIGHVELGIRFTDLIGRLADSGYYHKEMGSPEEVSARRVAGHRVGPMTHDIHSRDDRWVRTKELPLNDGGTAMLSTDVTILRRRAEEMVERESRYRLMAENTTDLILRHDLEGRIRYATPAAYSLIGVSSEDLLGRVATRWIHPEDQPRAIAGFDAMTTGSASVTYRFKRGDGEYIWVETQGRGLMDDDGEVREVVTVTRDVTPRIAAETALRESERRLRALVESSTDMVMILDRRGRVQYASPAIETVLGYPLAEIEGVSLLTIIDPTDKARVTRAFLRLLADPEGKLRITFRCRSHSGEWRWTEATGANCLDDSAIGGVVLNAYDVTDRVRQSQLLELAKEEAEIASRAKSDFLAHMSHELRTPLNAIIGFSEILKQEMFGPVGSERYVDYAQDIYRSGVHLLDIINDILDLTKIEAGKVEVREELVELPRVIANCMRLVRDRAIEGKLELVDELPEMPPRLFADERKLKQILINLLSNAVKFTPAGGRITVQGSVEQDGGIRIAVRDTGIGMSRHEVPRALEPFRQVESRMTRRYEGTGLGLPLTKALVELHGGRLEIITGRGRGTSVSAVFPPSRTRPGRDEDES